MMVKKYSKTDGTVTVSGDDGKILTNLPSSQTISQAKARSQQLINDLTESESSEKSWSEKQKEHTEQLLKNIEVGVENLAASGQIENFIKHMSSFHNYSFNNQFLIWMQNREATQVAGYNRWEELGRQVRKGEQGLSILAPVMIKIKKKDDITGEEVEVQHMKGFRAVFVFDVAQTEPAEYIFGNENERDIFIKEWEDKGYTAEINPLKPLSVTITKAPQSPAKLLEGEAPEEMKQFVEKEMESLGIEYETKSQDAMGGANGQSWKDSSTGNIKISVRNDVDDAQKYKTLVHELMHVHLGHLDRMDEYKNHGHRGEMEVAVEALSYMIGNRFGLDTSDYSTGYMALWSKQNKDKLKKVLEEDVVPFYKKIAEKLPSLEEETPPMGTAALKRKTSKQSSKKTRWGKK
jgi:antirestriction protein ArdC